MSYIFEIAVDPDEIHDRDHLRRQIEKRAGRSFADFAVRRRSVDARSRRPKFVLQVEILKEAPDVSKISSSILSQFEPVKGEKRIAVIGAGPAGYFAALELIRCGVKPIVCERGRDVLARRKSLKLIQQDGVVDPDSNYCYGEGGAGAYSDGKLYTRSVKRGNVGEILDIFVAHGAVSDIKIDAHPHIGSNRLPRIIERMRETIIGCGGIIRFGARVEDILIENEAAVGVRLQDRERIDADGVILACGHSARGIFRMLCEKKIRIEAKPFAVGVRVEHPQHMIDEMQYHSNKRHPNLPAASYRLSCQINGRGIYSFCMCPGGFIVPTATEPGEIVLNGMSLAGRDAPFANAGMVAEIREEDLAPYGEEGPLAAMAFQADMETRAFDASGEKSQRAPAQRMTDFVEGRVSSTLQKTSYIPGVHSYPLDRLLPAWVAEALKAAFVELGRRKKGYYTEDALLLAVETRTSSPVRIPRIEETMMHPQVRGLYPCGEGAGYAGGIVSAAMDGVRVAGAAAESLGPKD